MDFVLSPISSAEHAANTVRTPNELFRSVGTQNAPDVDASRNRDTNDLDILLRLLLINLRILNLMHNIHPRNRSAEDSMFVVEPRLFLVNTTTTFSPLQKQGNVELTVFSVVIKN